MPTPTYGGNPIFGQAVSIQHTQNPTAAQVTSFFGLNGQQTLFAGTRGRVFMVRGCLVGGSVAALNSAEQAFANLADGKGRTLVDTRGRTWQKVIFRGEFKARDEGWLTGSTGNLILPYFAVFHGLV